MLTKDCKILLDYLLSINESNHIFGWSLISKNLPKSFDKTKLISVLDYLQKENYLSFEANLLSEVAYIELFHKATNYKEISWLEIKSFLIKSILIPIIVSACTTAIGLLINSLF